MMWKFKHCSCVSRKKIDGDNIASSFAEEIIKMQKHISFKTQSIEYWVEIFKCSSERLGYKPNIATINTDHVMVWCPNWSIKLISHD